MEPRDLLRVVGVFGLVVVLVVGGTGLASFAVGSTSTEYTPVENEQFQPSSLLTAEADETGSVEMESEGEKTVVVDMAHGNAIDESDLQPLTGALVRNGHEVVVHSGGRLNESLRRADAYIVVSPRKPFTADETAGIRAFTAAGGRLLLLSEPPKTTVQGGFFSVTFDTVGDTHTGVASGYGLSFGDGYLYDMADDGHFKSVSVDPASETELTEDVDSLVFREAVPVVAGGNATAVAGDAGETTLSTTRRTGDHTLVARSGGVVAVGDTDFLRSENVHAADNEVFVGNLADFLVGGDKDAGAPKPPDEGESRPPGAPGPRPAPPSSGGSGDGGGGGGEPTPTPTETAAASDAV
jgi:hypothetical protein